MNRSEEAEQAAVFMWAEYMMPQHPELYWMFHCPNGGKRDKATAAKLKMMGVKPGVPDIILPVRRGTYSGLAIEMKVGDNGATANQMKWIRHFAEQGYTTAICYGADVAIKAISDYLGIKEGCR